MEYSKIKAEEFIRMYLSMTDEEMAAKTGMTIKAIKHRAIFYRTKKGINLPRRKPIRRPQIDVDAMNQLIADLTASKGIPGKFQQG